jgi:hypothetical protein
MNDEEPAACAVRRLTAGSGRAARARGTEPRHGRDRTSLAAILLSLLVARVATVAFVLTGLSKEAARSVLSGTGFTTSEAEGVVGHPVRPDRMVRMLVGSERASAMFGARTRKDI